MQQILLDPPAVPVVVPRHAPLFPSPIHVGCPNVGNTEKFHQRMAGVFASRQLTNGGPLVREFESRIAAFVGVKHVIVTCNATIALEIAIRALALSGEVIVPSFTFIATAHALQWQNITPVFCDVAPGTQHIDPNRIAERITPRTTGILAVHTFGLPCDIAALQRVADQHHLPLLFDAAHAFGCSYNGRMIGNFGRAEVFSFHATKFINSFEGGAIATNDDALAAKIRLMANFGFAGYDKVVSCGTNAKMHEASAAMGLTNLESIDEFIAVNRRNRQLYQAALRTLPGIQLVSPAPAETERRNFQYVILQIDANLTGITRDRLIEILWAENILARRYFSPGCHRSYPYSQLMPQADGWLPNTNALCQSLIALPTGTAVTPAIIHGICQTLRAAIAASPLGTSPRTQNNLL